MCVWVLSERVSGRVVSFETTSHMLGVTVGLESRVHTFSILKVNDVADVSENSSFVCVPTPNCILM